MITLKKRFASSSVSIKMPSRSHEGAALALRPILEECGYTGDRLAVNYSLNGVALPLVGFVSKPWDFDSACIVVVDDNGDSERAARSCYDLAAPVVWVRRNGSIDWWIQRPRPTSPELFRTESLNDFHALVRERKTELHPASIYRGKTIARFDRSRQLDFVDVGLMPLLRDMAGRKLGDLVEEMTRLTLESLAQRNPSKHTLHQVFTCVFRLLAGKILKDKKVSGFGRLDLADPASVLATVANHYDSENEPPRINREWNSALKKAASRISASGSFAVVSPETLAYVYEHTLVTPTLRKRLGIHATPPWLVDYMVWKLYDWIRTIPEEDRHVFEPACGHAPFLLSAMRLLRLESRDVRIQNVHIYLKKHLHGIEVDDFASRPVNRTPRAKQCRPMSDAMRG